MHCLGCGCTYADARRSNASSAIYIPSCCIWSWRARHDEAGVGTTPPEAHSRDLLRVITHSFARVRDGRADKRDRICMHQLGPHQRKGSWCNIFPFRASVRHLAIIDCDSDLGRIWHADPMLSFAEAYDGCVLAVATGSLRGSSQPAAQPIEEAYTELAGPSALG